MTTFTPEYIKAVREAIAERGFCGKPVHGDPNGGDCHGPSLYFEHGDEEIYATPFFEDMYTDTVPVDFIVTGESVEVAVEWTGDAAEDAARWERAIASMVNA